MPSIMINLKKCQTKIYMIIIILLSVVFISLQHSAECKIPVKRQSKNSMFFNEFMENLLDKNDAKLKHEAGKTELNIADAAKILEMVERNVAEKICFHSELAQMEIDIDIHAIFTEILKDLKEINHNEKIEEIYKKLAIKFTSMDDKVQFVMLLLSFASRLALTMGSMLLEEQWKLLGFTNNFSIDSFALAYNKMEKEFPVIYERADVKDHFFRYFHGAKLQMNADLTAILFDFKQSHSYTVYDDSVHRKYNFDTLLYYAQERRKERVVRLINELWYISGASYSPFSPYEANVDAEGMLTDKLIQLWKWMLYRDPIYCEVPCKLRYREEITDPLILLALKTFAANLIKLMLHKKETLPEAEKYFRKYGNAEKELNRILADLNKEMQMLKKQEKFSEEDFNILATKEMLSHFEDVAQIDWSTEEEFSLMGENLKSLFHGWETQLEKCKFENGTFKDCQIEVKKIKQEIAENESAIKSLFLSNENEVLELPVKMKNFYEIFKHLEAIHKEVNSLMAEETRINAQSLTITEGLEKLPKKQKIENNLDEKLKKFDQLYEKCISVRIALERNIQYWTRQLQREIEDVQEEFNRLG